MNKILWGMALVFALTANGYAQSDLEERQIADTISVDEPADFMSADSPEPEREPVAMELPAKRGGIETAEIMARLQDLEMSIGNLENKNQSQDEKIRNLERTVADLKRR